jgi:hypothetical protein
VAEGLTHAIGEALLELVELVWPAAAPHVGRVARQVADAVRPDPPFSVTTQDGEVVTGVLVVDGGRVLFFFGTRHAAASKPAYRPPDQGYPERGYPPPSYDRDQSPLWSPPYTR